MRKNRFWLELVGLCAAVACASAIALAAVSATTALTFASRQEPAVLGDSNQDAAGRQKVFTGVVTDTSCGARHMATDKNASQCARECVRKGASYALVDGDRFYRLEGNAESVEKLAGQRAQITGLLEGKVVTVTAIGPAQ